LERLEIVGDEDKENAQQQVPAVFYKVFIEDEKLLHAVGRWRFVGVIAGKEDIYLPKANTQKRYLFGRANLGKYLCPCLFYAPVWRGFAKQKLPRLGWETTQRVIH